MGVVMEQEEGNSYLLLTSHPSTYTMRYQYTQVMLAHC
jgi:phage portal protein BeeE